MPDIESLEQYFDILLHKDGQYSAEHPLADDAARCRIYDEVKNDFSIIGDNLHNINPYLKMAYPEYADVVNELAGGFKSLANTSYEDLDFCVRAIAVERLIFKKDNAGDMTPQMLGYLVEALLSFFYEEGEEVLRVIKEALKNLKETKQNSLFKHKKDEELKTAIIETLTLYEEIEEDLTQAKYGLIAKDKKMMQVLRGLRMDMGRNLVQMALEKGGLGKGAVAQSIMQRAKNRLMRKTPQKGR